MADRDERISRRKFIGQGVAAAVGAGVAGAVTNVYAQTGEAPKPVSDTAAEESKPEIQGYRRFGRTGYKVSDIGFGNARMQDPSLLEYAIERGINYVDTARQYFDMEKVVGQIFPEKRDKVFVTTKLEPETVTADVSEADLTKAIEESLERLNTDYIDCCLIHSVGDPNLGDITRIQNPNVVAAFEKARKAGKIRYWGASAHGPEMFRDFNWLIDNTDIDVIMPGMNYMTKGLEPVLAKAKKKDVAVVAMKSLSAARKVDFSAYKKDGRTIRQALLKWMLAQPNIDTISITMSSFSDVDEFVGASGKPAPVGDERKKLEEYGMLLDRDYCRPGCDACLGSCPTDVPIHDIMRYRLYFNNYGNEKYAMGLYAGLPASKQAAQCASCAGPCAATCPHSLPIREKLMRAHAELTI